MSTLSIVIQKEFERRRQALKQKHEQELQQLKSEESDALAALDNANLMDLVIDQPEFDFTEAKTAGRVRVPAIERIRRVLPTMSEYFSRMEIFRKVNNDGLPEIPIGTFSPAFSELIKKEEISTVSSSAGSKRGLYRRGKGGLDFNSAGEYSEDEDENKL